MDVLETPTNTHKLLLAKADQVIWLLAGCGGDVIVIGGRAGVMTLNQPTAGCCWLVVYSHCHLSLRERNDFTLLFFLSCLAFIFSCHLNSLTASPDLYLVKRRFSAM